MRRGKTRTLACMQIRATRLTATLTGLWTGFGMGTLEAWHKHNPIDPSTHQLLFFVMLVPFVFIPGILFVAGTSQVAKASASSVGHMALRMLCWMLGAAVAAMIAMPLVGRLHAS
jgi:hypothetical protein